MPNSHLGVDSLPVGSRRLFWKGATGSAQRKCGLYWVSRHRRMGLETMRMTHNVISQLPIAALRRVHFSGVLSATTRLGMVATGF